MKFEKGVRSLTHRLIQRKCLKENESNIVRRRDCKEREEYLRRNDYSRQGIVKLREKGEDTYVVLELATRDKQVQEQQLKNEKYNI